MLDNPIAALLMCAWAILRPLGSAAMPVAPMSHFRPEALRYAELQPFGCLSFSPAAPAFGSAVFFGHCSPPLWLVSI